jgi:hypothetical protein
MARSEAIWIIGAAIIGHLALRRDRGATIRNHEIA